MMVKNSCWDDMAIFMNAFLVYLLIILVYTFLSFSFA